MSIKLTAYDTTACNGLLTRTIVDGLEKAYISSSLAKEQHHSLNSEFDFNFNLVQGGDTFSDHIPYFSHPILFKTGDKDQHRQPVKELALDVRNFGKVVPGNQQFTIRNQPEYDWAIGRLILNNIWIKGRPEIIRDISIIPAQVYTTLISETVARRFGLTQRDQMVVAVASAYYYYSSFTNDVFEDLELTKVKSVIQRVTRVPSELIDETIDWLDGAPINTLEFLCEVIKGKAASEALLMLNVGILVSLVSSLWTGNNAKEIMAVGLDHPPTWVMVVYGSIQENAFKKSMLSKTSARFDKSGAGDNFVHAVKTLLGNFGNEEFFDPAKIK